MANKKPTGKWAFVGSGSILVKSKKVVKVLSRYSESQIPLDNFC